MERRRSYHQFCGVARALDVLGERWTLLLVRNLLLGPRRYSDLLAELPGLTTNLLAKRLQDLEEAGVVERHERPAPVAATVYRLTARGEALEPVIMEVGRWGTPLLDRPKRGDTINPGWALLSLKRRHRGGLDLRFGVEVGEQRFDVSLQGPVMRVQEREPLEPVFTLRLPREVLRPLFFGEIAWTALVDEGRLEVTGDRLRVPAMLEAFGVRATAS